MNYSENKKVKIFGVPIDLGSEPLGVEMGAAAIRYAGLTRPLQFNNIESLDYGDLIIDRNRGLAKNGQIEESGVSTLLALTLSDGYLLSHNLFIGRWNCHYSLLQESIK